MSKKPTSSSVGAPLARYAAAKRMGDFVYFSGVIAVDPLQRKVINTYADVPEKARKALGETGELSMDVFEQAIRVQSWFVLNRIAQLAKEHGGDIQDVFKLVQYFKDLRDYPAYKRIRDSFYPSEPPVSTVVQVSAMLPNEQVLIEVEGTAHIPI